MSDSGTVGLAERMAEHVCTTCHQPVSGHPMRAMDGIEYWPPVCCKTCTAHRLQPGPATVAAFEDGQVAS